MKLTTVYITSKDRPQLLLRAVKSVLNQTHKEIDLIIVDDNSSSFDIFQWAKENNLPENVRLYRNSESKGACYSRNLAIKEAFGQFITGLDDDDYFHPKRIEIFLRKYDTKFAAITSLSAYISSPSSQNTEIDCKNRFKQILYRDRLISLENMKVYNIVGNQVLTETWKLREIGGFDENFKALQDYDTWFRLMKRFGDVQQISQIMYFCYQHQNHNNITSTHGKSLVGHEQFLNKHFSDFDQKDLESFTILKEHRKMGFISKEAFIRNINTKNFSRLLYLLVRGKVEL